jgi:nitrite reductase/ring-hydroxylating ferredoxin subunit
MERFVNVAKVDECKARKGKTRFSKGLSVAILNSDGAFYAIEDFCPFDGASLSDGLLNGTLVECPVNKARFFAPTGEYLWPSHRKHLRGLSNKSRQGRKLVLTWNGVRHRKQATVSPTRYPSTAAFAPGCKAELKTRFSHDGRADIFTAVQSAKFRIGRLAHRTGPPASHVRPHCQVRCRERLCDQPFQPPPNRHAGAWQL